MARPHAALLEAKSTVQATRVRVGASYDQIAEAIGINKNAIYLIFDVTDDHRHLRYGDLVAMSRNTCTAVRLFVHALLEPIITQLKESNGTSKRKR
jgi:hypothetical protein